MPAWTYDDAALREDLLDILTNLDPMETQLVSGLGTSPVESIRSEWLIKTLGTVKTNAYVEGVDASYAALTNPARLFNYTQIAREAFEVTDTERAVNTASFNDRFTQEATDALRELKNDMEFALMRGSLACGSGTGVRRLRGLRHSLSLVTSQSGISLTEAILNDYFQLVWDATSRTVDEVYGDMYIKRKISGFTAGATKNINSEDKRLVNTVDVYQADAAKTVKLFPHRYVTNTGVGDTHHDIIGIVSDLFKVGYLRKPFMRELAKAGDSTKGEHVVEFTLKNLHYNAGVWGKAHV